ncbi:acyltransferase family protein [Mucilaginibacter sp.]|uniref:acyltransferase family protein n=1 Tax=Mucilaginibacter sp. TaxID=1882438 RepID=UPI0035BBBA80
MKPHYNVLDGLRGTAAILVVVFHLLEAYYPDLPKHPMHHGYLAVDFFYLLSGFVVGYAYDDRWANGMTIKQFFKIRIIRLQPLLVLATLTGAVCFLINPYKDSDVVNIVKLIGITVLGVFLIPMPMNKQGTGSIYPLDGPCWSLMQEYVANIIYALIGRKLTKSALSFLVAICGVALIIVSVDHNGLDGGWGYSLSSSQFIAPLISGGKRLGYPNVWLGPVRMMFPFFAGLLLFRSGFLIRISNAYSICSVLLLFIFISPWFSWNGYYEAAIVIGVFPVIISMGAGGEVSGLWAKLCRFSGIISYPLYIMHYPFIYIYSFWIVKMKPAGSLVFMYAVGLFLFFILLAYAALKLYDEPVRAWLKKKFLVRTAQ